MSSINTEIVLGEQIEVFNGRTAALTGTDVLKVPKAKNLQITLANPSEVTGGTLVFRARVNDDTDFEALNGDDTIACSNPRSLIISGSIVSAIECVSTATGTASRVLFDIIAWN